MAVWFFRYGEGGSWLVFFFFVILWGKGRRDTSLVFIQGY
jgi:hypothetical protein